MAEKLLKSLEALKASSVASVAPLGGQDQGRVEKVLGEQEKINHMTTVAELVCSVTVRASMDFVRLLSASMESILLYCSDRNSTVRLNANESLNRIIVGLKESAITRVLWELFKEIKRNARARSLAAALSRFGELCRLIKANKCRSYVGHLLPSIARALKRDDELVQETLAVSMAKICPVLAPYMTESELQTLIKNFLSKLHSHSAATRRTAASSLALLCQYTRRQQATLEFLLNGLLNVASSKFGESPSSSSVIGALSCIRQLVPQLARPAKEDQAIEDSFGARTDDVGVNDPMPSLSPIISRQIHQLYVLVLCCTKHRDHNVVSAALEALRQMLSNPPDTLAAFLISQGCHLTEETDPVDGQSSSCEQTETFKESEGEEEKPSGGEEDERIGEDELEWTEGSLSLAPLDEDDGPADVTEVPEDTEQPEEESGSPREEEGSRLDDGNGEARAAVEEENVQAMDPVESENSRHDREGHIPLIRCARQICSAFLLSGCVGNLKSDKAVRVSIKSLAIRCVAAIVRLYPQCFLVRLKSRHSNSDQEGGPPQFISDVLMYIAHSDPLLRGEISMLIGSLVLSSLGESRLHFQVWESQVREELSSEPLLMSQLVNLLGKCLRDESTVCRMACSAVKLCLPTLLSSSDGTLGLELLLKLLDVGKMSYWLVKVELADVVACLDYRVVAFLQQQDMQVQATSSLLGLDIQQQVLDVLVRQLNDEDSRVRQAIASAFVRIVPRLFFGSKDQDKEPLVEFAAELANRAYPATPSIEVVTQGSSPTGHQKSKLHSRAVIEGSLGRVVTLLSTTLLEMNSKQSVMGCCRTLNLLADNFPVASYPKAWSCVGTSVPNVSNASPVSASSTGGMSQEAPRVTSITEPTKSGPLSLLKLQLKKSTPVVSSTDVSAKTGTTSHRATEETKTFFTRGSSGSQAGRGVESPSSLLGNLTAKSRKAANRDQQAISGGPLTVAMSLLKSSLSLDLQTHQDIVLLCAKLLHGCGVNALVKGGTKSVPKPEGSEQSWTGVRDRQLVPLMVQLVTHLFRLLNVLCHVMEDKEPRPPESKMRDRLLPNSVSSPGPGTSPKKKGKTTEKEGKAAPTDGEKASSSGKATKNKDSETEGAVREKTLLGSFHHLVYYNTLYESLKGSYSNYKVTVDSSVPEKFGSMLKTALESMSLVLELATVEDVGKHTGEIIGYMCTAVQFSPSETYYCVEQLLNALFGASRVGQPSASVSHLYSPFQPNISSHSSYACDVCITQPFTWLQDRVNDIKTTARHFEEMKTSTGGRRSSSSFFKWMKGRRRRGTYTFVGRPDVGPIVKYIGAFEPLVIRSLRQYTGTGDSVLQKRILQLLIQLIRLRVNYSMLDAEQAFLKYIISQVEHIEDGHVRDAVSLIPYIFRFFVLLSYERSQSSILSVPRLIQLCDGVMAGGQAARDYAIPSLKPVVYDLFVARNVSSSVEPDVELETQREVIISMLNRIVQHHEVLAMLVTVLQTSRGSFAKWTERSVVVMSHLLPRLKQQQVDLESHSALSTLHLLFASLATSSFRPVSTLVTLVFRQPVGKEPGGLARWLSGLLALLRVIVAVCTESELLKEIGQIDTASWLTSACQLLDDSPEGSGSDILVWNMFGLVKFLLETLQPHLLQHQRVGGIEEFVCELTVQFTLTVCLVLENYPAVLTAAKRICQQLEGMLKDLNSKFFLLMSCRPLLVVSWCHLLSLIEYQSEWWDYLSSPLVSLPLLSSTTSHLSSQLGPADAEPALGMRWRLVKEVALAIRSERLVQSGVGDCGVAFIQSSGCDLACLLDEKPVEELFKTVQTSSQLSGVFVECLRNKLTQFPLRLQKKAITCLRFVHLSYTASVVCFLLGTVKCCSLMPIVEAVCTNLVMRLTEMQCQDGHLYVSSDEVVKLRKSILGAQRPSVAFKKLAELLNTLMAQLGSDSMETARLPCAGAQRLVAPVTDLESFTKHVLDVCINYKSPPSTHQAHLLHCLSHGTILRILHHEGFDFSLLKFCISMGAERTVQLLARQGSLEEYELELPRVGLDSTEYFDEHGIDHLLDAAKIVLFEQIETYFSQRRSSQVANVGVITSSSLAGQLSADSRVFTVPLSAALFEYLGCMRSIPKADIPDGGIECMPDFSLDCLKHAFWLWQKVPAEDVTSLLNCSAKILENQSVCFMLCKRDHSQWSYQFVDSLFELIQSLLPEGQTLLIRTGQAPEASYVNTVESGSDCTSQVHERICSLVHWLSVNQCQAVPHFILRPLQSLVVSLARLPALESYARIPAILWLTASAVGIGVGSVPLISSNDLRDEEILQDYVARVLLLGWRNRQQFEVTWVTLQGLLSPPEPLDELPAEEAVEFHKVTCIALRAITSLLIQTTLLPTPGYPAVSRLWHVSRQKELPFLGSRAGKKLFALRSVIEGSLSVASSKYGAALPLFRSNAERSLSSYQYRSGQVNVTSLQVKVVTSDVKSEEQPEHEETDDIDMSVYTSRQTSQAVETVDVKSCLQLLLDLFSQWLDPSVSPRPPVMLVYEIVKSVVVLSDVFEEIWHFQWLLENCLRLAAVHFPEDEQIHQYLILGACKASAVLRNEQCAERVAKLALAGLLASQTATRVMTLNGILYILEAHAGADMRILLPSLADHVISMLLQAACGDVHVSEDYQLVLWSTAFFLVEQYSGDLKLTDFSARVVKVALVSLSNGDVLPHSVFSAVIHCLERLLLSFSLSKSDREAVSSVALERYDSASCKQSLPALGLLLTYLYTGRSADQASGIGQLESETLNDPGMEGQLAVLEKLTKILDRMHKAPPVEANVVAQMLPALLEDFMPRHQIMTKVVGEFLSSQQPYPGLMADVMFKVFENLIRKEESDFITEWVLLSVGSVVQRTPLAMAVWSLNCLFVCSSLNGPIHAQFPCLRERLGLLDDFDGEFLAMVVEEFYHNRGLRSDQRQSLIAVFRSAAADHEVYQRVVSRLEESVM